MNATRRFGVVAALVAGAMAMAPHDASAQPDGLQRPYRGLFGGGGNNGGGNNPNSNQSLVLGFSAFGSYDDDLTADARQSVTPTAGLRRGGYFAGGSARLGYGRTLGAGSLSAQGATTMRYNPNQRDLNAGSVFAGVGYGMPIGTRTSFHVSATGFRAPRYQVGVLGSSSFDEYAEDVVGDTYALHRRDTLGASARVSASRQLTRRVYFDTNYGYRLVDYSDTAGNAAHHTGGASFRSRVTSYSTARLGYQYRQHGITIDGEPLEEHHVIAGLDFSRPWSLSGRRTQLTIHPGWSVMRIAGRTRLRATGSAMLDHQIGRSWTAHVDYSRGVRTLDGLDVYSFSDRARVSVSGLLTRRVDMVASVAYLTGNYGRSSTAGLGSYTGSVQTRLALTRFLAAYGQYFYYQYKFDRPDLLPGWFSNRLERHGVRVGLTAHVPLIQ